MQLCGSQQMLRYNGEGTVLNYGVPVAKEVDVHENFKLGSKRFW